MPGTSTDTNKDNDNMDVDEQSEPVSKKTVEEIKKEKEEQKALKAKDPNIITISSIADNIGLLEKGVVTKETRYVLRVIRTLSATKPRLTSSILKFLLEKVYSYVDDNGVEIDCPLLQYLSNVPSDPSSAIDVEFIAENIKGLELTNTPEVIVYLHLLVLIYLLRDKQTDAAIRCSDELILLIKFIQSSSQNVRRATMDCLIAKGYSYYALSYELIGRSKEIRTELVHGHRTATLRNNTEGQATLINLLLRNYINHKLFNSAVFFLKNSKFPENCSNNELARFHYYMGKLCAIELKYQEANEHLEEALRKAPYNGALGFHQEVTKWLVVTQLLMGRIPSRSTFRKKHIRRSLYPYFQITKAVKLGDIVAFNNSVDKYVDKFKQVQIFNLIMRCRHNVIKAGLRNICQSYNRISLKDVCKKLYLDSSESAEFIVAKAVRDGVVQAEIDHINGYVIPSNNQNVYLTSDPQNEYHSRIMFCMRIHNASVKALRFPTEVHKTELELESPEERRQREFDILLDDDDEDLNMDDI